MMQYKSDFEPKLEIQNKYRILDPNPNGNQTVPPEDLYIYVSLKAKQKSKSFFEVKPKSNLIEISTFGRNTFDLLVPQENVTNSLFKNKPEGLTTDWTEIGGFQQKDLYKDFETFGITNIDISIKSQVAPQVTIDFVDVRGATLFEQGSCSPYGLFFSLPYPIFELTLKGYYGKAVNYYLNLTKFTTKFNSETGNMECRAEFIGYTFAFLSDVIVGYVMASQYLDKTKYSPQSILEGFYTETNKYYDKEGSDPFCVDGKCTTIMDLLKSIDKFEDYEKPRIAGSDEYKEVGAYNELRDKYKYYLETLNTLVQELGESNKKTVTACVEDEVKGVDYKFLIDENTTPTLIKDKDSLIPGYFKRTSEGLLANQIKEIMLTKINDNFVYNTSLKDGKQIKCLLKNPGQFSEDDDATKIYPMYDSPDLKNKPWFIGILKNNTRDLKLSYPPAVDNETDYLEKENLDVGGSSIIDLGYLIADAKRELKLINDTIQEKKKLLLEEINRIVESDIGFKPTIKNIFTVLLCNTDAFMEILRQVGEKAENHHLQYNNDSRNRTSKNGNYILSGEEKVYAWPTYSEKGKEKYPGENTDFLDWPEVIFVEDFIKAYFDMNKDVELLNNETEGKVGFDNFVPINTIESRYWEEVGETPTPTKYLKTLDSGGSTNEILKTIVERMFLTLDHSFFQPIRLTNDAMLIPKIGGDNNWSPLNNEEFIKQLAIIDSWNLLNSMDNSKQLNMVNSFTPEDIINKIKSKEIDVEYFQEIKGNSIKKIEVLDSDTFNKINLQKQLEILGTNDVYYLFMSNKEKGIEIKNDIWAHPNPNKMADTIKIRNLDWQQGFEQNDTITISNETSTGKEFNKALEDYRNIFIRTTEDIDFDTKNFNKDKPKVYPNVKMVDWDSKQQIISFDKPQLFSTLAISFKKEEAEINNWWLSGDNMATSSVGGSIDSNMGILSTWSDKGDNHVTFLTFTGSLDDGSSYPLDYFDTKIDVNAGLRLETSDNNKPTTDSLHPWFKDDESENPDKLGEAINSVTSIFDAFKDKIKPASTATLVNSPLWLDNVNNFRKKIQETDGYIIPEVYQLKNLAYLFLNTLKPTPLIKRLIDNDGYLYNGYDEEQPYSSVIWSLKAFNLTSAIVKVPKFWLLALGSQLWRWKEFVGTKEDGTWIKCLNAYNTTQTNYPKGQDPLIQPGYNSIFGNGVNSNGSNGIITESDRAIFEQDIDRNNPVTYLNKIYKKGYVKEGEIFKFNSVFGANRFNAPKTDNRIHGYPINGFSKKDDKIYFPYFSVYKDNVGTIGKFVSNVGAIYSVGKYSWPQLYLSPHHIPYVSPELFDEGNYGRGSQFIMITNNWVGYQDYVSIMPQTIGSDLSVQTPGSTYTESEKYKDHGNDIFGTVLSLFGVNLPLDINKAPYYTLRNKKLDGNLGMVFQYLPDKVKNEIVKIFEEWATSSEWKDLLKIIDPVNFNNDNLMKNYSYQKGKSSPAYMSEYKNSEGKSEVNYLLALNPNDSLKKLYNDQYWIVNSTPKIWYGYDEAMENTSPGNSWFRTNTEIDTPNQEAFIVSKKQFDLYLKTFSSTFNSNKNKRKKELEDKNKPENNDNPLDVGPIDDTDVKLSLYRTFKSMTDKWISASKDGKLFFNITHSEGKYCSDQYNAQRKTIASHFQYVNRTMGDIGDVAVINILKLNELRENKKISLYSYLADLLVDNQYEFFPLPATINLTGDGVSGEDLKDMFRPYIGDVTDISCGPSFICMYVGGGSRQIKLSNNTKCPIDKDMLQSIEDDGFGFTDIDLPEDISGNGPDENGVESQGYTAFKILYGIQNQNHFKSIQLDQSEFSETAESILVLDKLSQQGADKKAIKGQNLNAAYLTRSYSCQVESLGNMMIQPMTYFDLQGVPMFSGAFLITEVSHNFKPNNASTNFKGVRQPRATVPIVTDVAIAMNISFKDVKAIDSGSITGIGGNRRSSLEETGGSNGIVLAKVPKQPCGVGTIITPSVTFDNSDLQALDNYGATIGITDKSDNATLYKLNQPTKPIGNILNSAYANLNVPTRPIPSTNDGNLGCASAVSIIFYRATGYALVGDSAITLGTTTIYDHLDKLSNQPNSCWEKITDWKNQSKPGDIICTAKGSTFGHIGVVVNGNKIISNNSKGFNGDKKGQIELNYSITSWQEVANRNPNKTASFRYIGPYANKFEDIKYGNVGSGDGSVKSKSPNEKCGKASVNTVNTEYPRSNKWLNGPAQLIVQPTNPPSVTVKKADLPVVAKEFIFTSDRDMVNAIKKVVNKMAPNASNENKKKILYSAFSICKSEQSATGGFSGPNFNYAGVEGGSFQVYDRTDVKGKAPAKEGNTTVGVKYYYAFKDVESFLAVLIFTIMERNMFGAGSDEANEWAWRWFRDWNGYGARTTVKYQTNPNYTDCTIVANAEKIYNSSKKTIDNI